MSLFTGDGIIYLEKSEKSVNIIKTNNSKVAIYMVKLKPKTLLYIRKGFAYIIMEKIMEKII